MRIVEDARQPPPPQPENSGSAGGSGISVSESEEADDYSRSVAGLEISAVRMGMGEGLNVVRSLGTERMVANSNLIRVPMASLGLINDDRIVACAIQAAPSGARWCDIDLEPGMVVVYGPGAVHTGSNPIGSSFAFVSLRTEQLVAHAELTRTNLDLPEPGRVQVLPTSAETTALYDVISSLHDRVGAGADAANIEREAIHTSTTALANEAQPYGPGHSRMIDNREITRDCLEFAESVNRLPTIAELCTSAHVSKRRLHTAFRETYGMPPARFFRIWALGVARQQLVQAEPATGHTVTSIAMDAGFNHLGRFAGAYGDAFGEKPSATLAKQA